MVGENRRKSCLMYAIMLSPYQMVELDIVPHDLVPAIRREAPSVDPFCKHTRIDGHISLEVGPRNGRYSTSLVLLLAQALIDCEDLCRSLYRIRPFVVSPSEPMAYYIERL